MSRKPGEADWLVTFADLVTLLFCFFVLLTSLSAAPKNCEGIRNHMDENQKEFVNFELRSTKSHCIISLPSDFLFTSGKAELQRKALLALRPFFQIIKRLPEHENDLVIVEGHTDDVPIKTKEFPSNWELSSSRATNFSTFLVKSLKYPGETVSVAAYAEFRPKVSYIAPAGNPLTGEILAQARKTNRRVEIILGNQPVSLDDTKLLFDGRKE